MDLGAGAIVRACWESGPLKENVTNGGVSVFG